MNLFVGIFKPVDRYYILYYTETKHIQIIYGTIKPSYKETAYCQRVKAVQSVTLGSLTPERPTCNW